MGSFPRWLLGRRMVAKAVEALWEKLVEREGEKDTEINGLSGMTVYLAEP